MNVKADRRDRRILVIDDTESIHADFRKILCPPQTGNRDLSAAKAALFGAPVCSAGRRYDFSISSATQGRQGVELAAAARQRNEPFQVAFVDMRMPPGWDGMTTLQHLWEIDPALQIVICTAYSDFALDQLPQDLGADGRLLVLKKPFEPVEVLHLAATLSSKWHVERAATIEMEHLEHLVQQRTADIEHAALHDRLTGLPNRTLLHERISRCIARRSRNATSKFALLFLDFDRFKLINDSFGHEIGDQLLVEISNRLRSAIRQADTVSFGPMAARHGGDEFIILLEELQTESDAARVAERILGVLAESYSLQGQRVFSTVSIGIATSDRGYETPDELIRDADTAMYRAKAAGRGRYVMFDCAMHQEAVHRLSLESSLRQAIREETIELHYQPIMRLEDGVLSGFEALLRFRHPVHGAIPPSQIIAIAEETGLIQPLSMCVLKKACTQLSDWRNRFPDSHNLLMSVNFSRKQLIDPDLIARIKATIESAGIPSQALVLEITESTLMEDGAGAEHVFEQLKQLGIWLYLDDFGTGFSSLGCLYSIPLNGMKIDRGFMQEVSRQAAHMEVFEAIVNIARAFNLRIVAEGVETTEQYQLLRRLQVDYGQGYLFGKAVPAASAERLLTDMPTLCQA